MAAIAARSQPCQQFRSAQDRKFRHFCNWASIQLQNNWTGHRVGDAKAAAEIFKFVAERIQGGVLFGRAAAKSVISAHTPIMQ